jgi:phosphoenolpyruvate carboxykinase (diphosphate)
MDIVRAVGIGGVAQFEERQSHARRLAEDLIARNRSGTPRAAPCPADRRIEAFLNSRFDDLTRSDPLQLPTAIALPAYGIARELSVPADTGIYKNEYVTSYRVCNGVLHNPRSDRRTTKGTFHVCEGGLPIPGDKKAVPRGTFVALFREAMKPPADLLAVPLTATAIEPARAFVSLLLRPTVCPEVPGVEPQQSMEVRFFVPGGLVSNLDFVESIFGNAGDPSLAENDAGLDVEHWTGHTGCVILAPHLTRCTKNSVGLPHWDEATARQRRDGMCWREPDELYNDGQAFKVTCRDAAGVIVTLIADNYYGYCKKEVKTQISYAANLYGNVEEEHAGGALAFARYNLGPEFNAADYRTNNSTINDLARRDANSLDMQPEGYAIDRHSSDLIYVPHDARASVERLEMWWSREGRETAIPLRPGRTYMTPSGYKVTLDKHPSTGAWRLVGTVAEGLFCHKPCTVSGGGKSEISKNLGDYILYGPILVADLEKDLDLVQKIFDHDYSNRWKPGREPKDSRSSRPLLSPARSLGSVIKLLTPAEDYTPEYNAWLAALPDHIFPLVHLIKRYVPQDQLNAWRELFSVDSINGRLGHELKAMGRRLVGSYLRVGLLASKGWRTFKLRHDFATAVKIQMEDDITASAVVPANRVGHLPAGPQAASYKFATNCEFRLFQRPDDAIHRGLDRQTESDMSRPDNFVSNFEPLSPAQAQAIVERVTDFDDFSQPMRQLLAFAAGKQTVVCSSYPRLVDGKPSKNPRYLQIRPDLLAPDVRYVAERGMRLARGISSDEPLLTPVGAVLIGRRNNPPDRQAGVRALAVYNPIHYQELPEFFMDVICSLTGKSPSTTGAGSEGALTKAPFNALRTIVDLNAALVSYTLTGLPGFSTAAGFVGPDKRVDHDISLLVPEVWCRLTPQERDPAFLIGEGHLELLKDFEHQGRKVLASRLGYRITAKFVRTFFGRIFDHPDRVFDEAYLRPETQDLDAFVDGVHNITEAQERVALQAFDDGSIDDACPPLRALLSIMAHGEYEGKDAHHSDVRKLFTREALERSDWYRQRLIAKQHVDQRLWQRHLATLDARLKEDTGSDDRSTSLLHERRTLAAGRLAQIATPAYLESLRGTLGVDPSLYRESTS